MKRLHVVPLVLGLSILACSLPANTQTSPTPAIVQTLTAEAPTATGSPVSPSAPAPTLAPTPTPTPLPVAISPLNGSHLAMRLSIDNPDSRRVVFSPDGSLFAVCSGNDANFAIKIWRTADGKLAQTISQFTGIVWDLAFSPDGSLLAAVANEQDKPGVTVWRVSDGGMVKALSQPKGANSVAFSPDGKTLAAGGIDGFPNGMIYLYDTVGWQPRGSLQAPGQNVLSLAYTPDGKLLASGGTDGKIRLWDIGNGTLKKTLFHTPQLSDLAISPSGELIATNFCTQTGSYGCAKGGVIVWRIGDGTQVKKFADFADGMVFSPDGSLLFSGSGGAKQDFRLYNVADWSQVVKIDQPAISAAFSPDRTVLVTVDHTTVKLWGVQ